jgi:hypothetical protein
VKLVSGGLFAAQVLRDSSLHQLLKLLLLLLLSRLLPMKHGDIG